MGNTWLHVASDWGEPIAVRYLIRRFKKENFSIDHTNMEGKTALCAALESSHGICYDTVKLLLEAGADVNLRDKYNETPFFCFIERLVRYRDCEGYEELLKVIQLLFERGANPMIKERYRGKNIFFVMAEKSNFITANYLKERSYLMDETSKIDCVREIFSQTQKIMKQQVKEIEKALLVSTNFSKDIINLLLWMCVDPPWSEVGSLKQRPSDIAEEDENFFLYFFIKEMEKKGWMKGIDDEEIKNIIEKTIHAEEKSFQDFILHGNMTIESDHEGNPYMLKTSYKNGQLVLERICLTLLPCKVPSLLEERSLRQPHVYDIIKREKRRICRRKHNTLLIVEKKRLGQILIFNMKSNWCSILKYKPERQNIPLSALLTQKNKPIRSQFKKNTNLIGTRCLCVPNDLGLSLQRKYNCQPISPPLELPQQEPTFFSNGQPLYSASLSNITAEEDLVLEQTIYATCLTIFHVAFLLLGA